MRNVSVVLGLVGLSLAATAPAVELSDDEVYFFQVCESGDTSEAARLLEAGITVNLVDESGRTPLILAGQAAEPALVRLLLESGADPKATAEDGINALLAVVHSCGQYGPEAAEDRQPFIDSARLLIAAGVPLDGRDAEGRDALAIARHYKDETLVPTLREAGIGAER